MKISQHTAVQIHYTLKSKSGEVLDSTIDDTPITYIHGSESLLIGLESALEGKTTGDKLSVKVPPETGYGVRDESLIEITELSTFENPEDVQPGVQFEIETPQGPRFGTIIEVNGDDVTIDLNHPMADQTLFFEVEILNVREATELEVENGLPDA